MWYKKYTHLEYKLLSKAQEKIIISFEKNLYYGATGLAGENDTFL